MTDALSSCKTLIADARATCLVCESKHIEAMVKEGPQMLQWFEKELVLWRELYVLYNEAADCSSRLIDLESRIVRGDMSTMLAENISAAEQASAEVDHRIRTIGSRIHSLGTIRTLWQTRTIELGSDVQTSQELVQTLQETMAKLVRG